MSFSGLGCCDFYWGGFQVGVGAIAYLFYGIYAGAACYGLRQRRFIA